MNVRNINFLCQMNLLFFCNTFECFQNFLKFFIILFSKKIGYCLFLTWEIIEGDMKSCYKNIRNWKNIFQNSAKISQIFVVLQFFLRISKRLRMKQEIIWKIVRNYNKKKKYCKKFQKAVEILRKFKRNS